MRLCCRVFLVCAHIIFLVHAMQEHDCVPCEVHVLAVVDELNRPLCSLSRRHPVMPQPFRDHIGCIEPDFVRKTAVMEFVSLISVDGRFSCDRDFFWNTCGVSFWVDERGFWCSCEEEGDLNVKDPDCWMSRQAFEDNRLSGGTAVITVPSIVRVHRLLGSLRENTHYWVIVRVSDHMAEAILDPKEADAILKKFKK